MHSDTLYTKGSIYFFKDKQEYEYAMNEYLNSIKFPPFQVYFAYYQDPNTMIETKTFDYLTIR